MELLSLVKLKTLLGDNKTEMYCFLMTLKTELEQDTKHLFDAFEQNNQEQLGRKIHKMRGALIIFANTAFEKILNEAYLRVKSSHGISVDDFNALSIHLKSFESELLAAITAHEPRL